ncbi:MAG TPA: DoxX family membrane protein [Actinotalea sp.]|nr:DoxX family membrane protein [Actinotalea sp.]
MSHPVMLTNRWTTVQPWVSTTLRLVLAGICLWAGLAKIGDLAASVRAVRAFELLPEVLAKPVGYGLPVVEILLGLLLLGGLLTRYAAAAVAQPFALDPLPYAGQHDTEAHGDASVAVARSTPT